jgi:septum formation protein
VVVHEGIIREKPTTKEEARQFLKGLLSAKCLIHNVLMHLFIISESLSSLGYSGGHVSTVGSVVVTNLTTGKRLGSLDKAEVIFSF